MFEYLFNTPILKFENVFIINEETDEIFAINSKVVKRAINNLSSSERLFFEMWLAHFTGNAFEFKGGWIYNLDNKRKRQFEYFISVLDILKS